MSPDAIEHLTIQKLDDAYRIERDAIYEAKRKLDQRAERNLATGYRIRARRDRLAAKTTEEKPVPLPRGRQIHPAPCEFRTGGGNVGAVRPQNTKG